MSSRTQRPNRRHSIKLPLSWVVAFVFLLAVCATAQSSGHARAQQAQYPQQQYTEQQQQQQYPQSQQYAYPQQLQYPQQREQQYSALQQQQQQYPIQSQQEHPVQQQQQYPQQQQQYPQQQHLYSQQQQLYPQQQQQEQLQYPQPQQQYPVQPYSDSNWKHQQRERAPLPMAAPAAAVDSWTAGVDRLITRGILQLSLNLSAAVARDSDLSGVSANVVFSPVNVAAALALVLAGSNGTTFQEIAKVLGLASGVDVNNRELVHKEFGHFLSLLEKDRNGSAGNASAMETVFANGLFVQRDFTIQPYFLNIAQFYKSEVIPVEFQRDPSHTKDKINTWFSDNTRGRIKAVLAEAPPTDTRLMIASALFFNGAWETPFPLEATMVRPFNAYSSNGAKELFAVWMMTNNVDLPYVVDRALGCRMLELPYRGREVSMFLILPDAQGLDKLRELEARLTPEIIEGLIAGMKEAPVIYSVPRMKLERSISLRTALETLGVRSLFDSRLADLSHLADPLVNPVVAHAAPTSPAPSTPATTSATAVTPRNSSSAATKQPGVAVGDSSSNAIAPSTPFYFAGRMTDLSSNPNKVNSTAPEHFIQDRWGTPSSKLYADDVLHKVEVEVTETGTVASAATAITISRDGSNHVMRFNRPFLFFIRHKMTGLLLFYGSVVRPQPEWIVPGIDPNLLLPTGAHRVPPSSSPKPRFVQLDLRRPPVRRD